MTALTNLDWLLMSSNTQSRIINHMVMIFIKKKIKFEFLAYRKYLIEDFTEIRETTRSCDTSDTINIPP